MHKIQTIKKYKKKIQWKSMGTKLFGYTLLKISSFVFKRRNKCIQVWNNMRESK